MEEKNVICIICPLGCDIVLHGNGKTVHSIEGSQCKRGEAYASQEFIAPQRILTTSVKVTGGESPLVPVRSKDPISKSLLIKCAHELRNIELKAPVGFYDTVVSDILGTGVEIVTTASVDAVL